MKSIFKSLKLPVSQLNLKAVLKCGQSFRWTMVPLNASDQEPLVEDSTDKDNPRQTLPTEEWRLTLQDRVIRLRQTENELFYRAYFPADSANKLTSEADDTTLLWLRDYFQLDIDLETLYSDWSKRDPMFKKVAPRFVGIRILRQDPWENLVSPPVCSSSELPGSPLGASWHPFPPPTALIDPGVETKLRELGFGYRAKYIQKTAAMLCEKHQDPMKELLALRQLTTVEARARLLEFHGVGPKVADCILLMSLDKPEVVPVDTHVQQIATKMYGFKSRTSQAKTMNPKLYSEIAAKFADTWGPYAGWAHSVLFTADLKSFANFGLEPSAAAEVSSSTLPLPSPAPLPEGGKPPLEVAKVKSAHPPKALRKRKSEPILHNTSGDDIVKTQSNDEDSLVERVKRRRRLGGQK